MAVAARGAKSAPIAARNARSCRTQVRSAKDPRAMRNVVTAAKSGIDTDELIKTVNEKWDAVENKPQAALYAAGAVVGLWVANTLVGAINVVPVLPKAFELVGLGYSAWFTYKYLLFKSSRQELLADIEELKSKIGGS